MRVLAHIHTFNDDEVIDQSLEAIRRQTRSPDKIIIVDNGSTDNTLARRFPEEVTVIRHSENLGTNGAIRTGFQYALDHAFDWTWVFDADSAPDTAALEHLLRFYDGLPAPEKEQICFLVCKVAADNPDSPHRPMVFTPHGGMPAQEHEAKSYARCDAALWSSSLYRMNAVRRIGLPSEYYVLDWGELEYGYRAKKRGFKSYMIKDVLVRHDIGGAPGIAVRKYRFGLFNLSLYEVPPIRCYYRVRNMIYFWLYQCKERGIRKILGVFFRSFIFAGHFLIRPASHGRQIHACLRGIWDGVTGNIERWY